MKNFFYISNFQTPHVETDLELIHNSVKNDIETHVLLCRGHLKTCFANQKNQKVKCNFCISKIDFGISLIENVIVHHQKKINFRMPEINEFNSVSKLKNYSFDGVNLGNGILSSLISTIRDHKFSVSKNIILVRNGIYSSILNYLNFKLLLTKIKPTKVYFFNGRFGEVYPLMMFCKKNNIEFYTHERGSSNDKYMLRKNNIPHSIDYTSKEIDILWSGGKKDKFEIGKIFFEERIKGIEQNWLSFSSLQEKKLLPKSFDDSKINISFFNSSMDEYETISDFENLIYKDDNDGIDRICSSFTSSSNINFYLRVHPNLKSINNTQIKQIRELDNKHNNLCVIYPEQKIDSYELVRKSDAVVSFNSTVGVEALFLGTKSILAGRAFYESLNEIIKCNSHQKVVNEIKKVKKSEKKIFKDHLKYGYWAKSFGTKYLFYKPETLFKGRFLGKNLNQNKKTFIWRLLNKIFYS